MGLDSVELLMAIEDSFQIVIENEEVADVKTIGDMHRLILQKLKIKKGDICLTGAAFYRTRCVLLSATGAKRGEIRPATLLKTIMPWRRRRRMWQDMKATIALNTPDLHHPVWFTWCSLIIAIPAAILLILGTLSFLPLWPLVGLMIATVLVIDAALYRFTPGLAIAFPEKNMNAGQLAQHVLARNYAKLAKEVSNSGELEVWESLCLVIENQLCIDAKTIRPDQSFIYDLGID